MLETILIPGHSLALSSGSVPCPVETFLAPVTVPSTFSWVGSLDVPDIPLVLEADGNHVAGVGEVTLWARDGVVVSGHGFDLTHDGASSLLLPTVVVGVCIAPGVEIAESGAIPRCPRSRNNPGDW